MNKVEIGEKGGGKGTALFGGMKVKGPAANKQKQEKHRHPQTETNFNFNESKEKQSRTNYTTDSFEPSDNAYDKEEIPRPKTQVPLSSNKSIPQNSKTERASTIEQKMEKKPDSSQDKQIGRKVSEGNLSDKKSNEDINKVEDKKQYASLETDDNRTDVEKHLPESSRKVSQKKQSASESNYQFQKKKVRDRKQSNPYLNQIKKNTSVAPSRSISHGEQQNTKSEPDTNHPPTKSTQKVEKKTDRQQLMEQLNQAHIKALVFIFQQKQLKQSIIQIAGSINQLKQSLLASINKQYECVEKQQYEQAQNYQNKIQNLQSKINEQEIQLNFKQDQYYEVEYDYLNYLKGTYNQSKKMVRKIKLVELQLLDDSSNVKRKLAEIVEVEKGKIENENKKILRLENDIKFQKDQLSSYEEKFQEDLDARRQPLRAQLSIEEKEKKKLEEEIAELEKLLVAKKESLKTAASKATSIKKQIREIEENFRQEGIKLQQRKKKLSSIQKQKEEMTQKLQGIQAKLKNSISSMEQQAQKLEEEAKTLASISNKIQQNSTNFDDQIEEKKVKVDNFIHNTKQLKKFQQEHKGQKEKIKELEFKKANITAEANNLEEKKTQLKNLIPKLQAEQKSMASAKNFKAAGMKKTEIKEAQQEIDQVNKKIETCFIEEKKVEEQIAAIENSQLEHVEQENEIRKNLAISQFKFDISKLTELKAELKWLQSNEANEETRSKYEGNIVEEIDNLVEEIKYIGEQYELDLKFLETGQKQSEEKANENRPKIDEQKAKSVGSSQKQKGPEPQQSKMKQEQSKQKQEQIKNQKLKIEQKQEIQIKQQDKQEIKNSDASKQAEKSTRKSTQNTEIAKNNSSQPQDGQSVEGKEEEQQRATPAEEQPSRSPHEESELQKDDDNSSGGGYMPLQLD